MPGNFVAALANYWIDKVSKMLEFERAFEGPAHASTTSFCATTPLTRSRGLFELLGVAGGRDGRSSARFSSDHGRGPGDYKIDYTGSISVESIGRGSGLPEHLAPAAGGADE